jgi:uncharacterized repeat protein (TIGR03803 family)
MSSLLKKCSAWANYGPRKEQKIIRRMIVNRRAKLISQFIKDIGQGPSTSGKRIYRFDTLAQIATVAAILAIVVFTAAASMAQTFTVLHTFQGGNDGEFPIAGLVHDARGTLYGTTKLGGTGSCPWSGNLGCGVVFTIDSEGKETILYSFPGGDDGQGPVGTLVRDADGNLFEPTIQGGNFFCLFPQRCGTLVKIDSAGMETVLYRFDFLFSGTATRNPLAGLVEDTAGNLYGTTFNDATIYRLGANGVFTPLYVFQEFSATDGANPLGSLVVDKNNNLYGITQLGGTTGNGTVFMLDQNGRETILHNFAASGDGRLPRGRLLRDATGNLYGTTFAGGTFNKGTIFKLDSSGQETVLYNFGAAKGDGANPSAGVILDSLGNLYGTTYLGGSSNNGTVFKLSPAERLTILHSFTGGADGAHPYADLDQDATGNLFGTTFDGGDPGFGTVFQLTP